MDQAHFLSATPILKSFQLASREAVKFLMTAFESAVTGSSGLLPLVSFSKAAMSHAGFARIPGEPKVDDGRIPLRESRPVETLSPYNAVNNAGQLIDPWVSVPKAKGANPAATAATGQPTTHKGTADHRVTASRHRAATSLG